MKQAPWIIIVLLLLVIVLMRECERPCPECPEQFIQVDTVPGDSVPVPYPVVLIKDRWRVVHDTIPAKVDTGAILADYFAKVYGTDTLADDSSVFVSIDWMVSENRLQSITPYIANRKPTAINIFPETKPRNRYFAGIGFGCNPNKFGFAPAMALLTKKQKLYSAHYDVLNRDAYVTVFFNLNKSK